MEKENREKYYVGQHVDAFIDCGWKPCLVTSVKASQPPTYGLVTIDKGANFYLSPDSIRHRTERRLLVEDSFEDAEPLKEFNVSVVSSDGDSIFITQSNMVADDSLLQDKDDSLIDFAKETEEFLTLTGTSTPRQSPSAVNRCQLVQSPPTNPCGGGSLLGEIEHADIHDNRVPEDQELDEALAMVDDELLTAGQDSGSDISPDFVVPEIPKKRSIRFAQVDDQDIAKLQKASKSERTHKQTKWAVKILTGNFPKSIFTLIISHENTINTTKKFTVIQRFPSSHDHMITREGAVSFYMGLHFYIL